MEPVLKTSTSWTPFPEDWVENLTESLKEQFADALEGREWKVLGRIYPEEIVLSAELVVPGQLRNENFQVAALYEKKEQLDEIMEKIVNLCQLFVLQYIEAGEEVDDLPRVWVTPDMPEYKGMFMKFTTDNSDLEAQADALLGLDDKVLVHDGTSEDALDRAYTFNNADDLSETVKEFGLEKGRAKKRMPKKSDNSDPSELH